ncbi:hypothetical protein [Anaerospora hongkongensis]|jgi:hypothetical protein|uniref:hypothetical protein n=1 Tax=Anaerospora hongkongensis TaxID=244830 RepID=UPI00289BDBAC|nr:hypothetical protein [Anaerospora hongkongensis]
MPTYRVLINQKATGDYVTSGSKEDAYFDVASSMALTYQDSVQFEEVNTPAHSMADQQL